MVQIVLHGIHSLSSWPTSAQQHCTLYLPLLTAIVQRTIEFVNTIQTLVWDTVSLDAYDKSAVFCKPKSALNLVSISSIDMNITIPQTNHISACKKHSPCI
eukprot:343685_1